MSYLAGLDVDLDFGEPGDERERDCRRAGSCPWRRPSGPGPASAVADAFVNLLMSFGSSWPSYVPPSSIARCAACASVMPATAALAEHALVGDLVVVRTAAEVLRRDLLQLLLRVHRRRVSGARHRVRGLAAAGDAGPRQVLRRVAPDDLAPSPTARRASRPTRGDSR